MKKLKYLIPSFTLLFIFSFLNCTKTEPMCLTTDQLIEINRIIEKALCHECQIQKETLIEICSNCHRKIIKKILCTECQNLSIEQLLLLTEQNKENTHEQEQTLIEILKHIKQCPRCQKKFNPSMISYFVNHPVIKTTTIATSLLIIFIKLFPVK